MESPLDRVKKLGIKGSNVIDLIAVGCARRPEDAVLEHAMKLTQRTGPIHANLPRLTPDLLKDEMGLDEFEALKVLALIDIGRRSIDSGKGDVYDFGDPAHVYRYLQRYAKEQQEHFITLCLDAKYNLLREHVAHVGTTDMSFAEPKDVFRVAISEGACGIIVAHNHPSGDPTPSPEDVQVTRRMTEAGRLIGITVYDHIIIGKKERTANESGFFSFHRAGLLK